MRSCPSGVLDFLQKPVVAFVRLADSVVMESALEIPVPIRFVFVLVGPGQGDMDYSETGRAMGALMADWVREKTQTQCEPPPPDTHTPQRSASLKAVRAGALTGVLSGGLPGPV